MKINRKTIPFLISLAIIIISLAPLSVYFYQFHGELSNNQTDWSSLGSFLSGTSGTLLSACSIFALIYTLHITLKNNEKTHNLTMESIKNNERQIKNMEREFSLKLFESYIDAFNSILEKKIYSINKKNIVPQEDFIKEAYRRLLNDLWSMLSNTIPENRRGFDFYRPAIVLSEMKISFTDEFKQFFYLIDTLDKTTDEETYRLMLRMYHAKINEDILFFISCYTNSNMTQFRYIFERQDRNILFLSHRAAEVITRANDLVKEGKTPWDDDTDF
ncbi:hypothetical protein I5403_15890 [Citrobacter farmeri]|uniref:hypothetical protein n=1 Tax=Citrobacter farmeri TaxID=67824 RepID=UPI001923D8CC|nr:hypothetical protein [Citrobacter farmeri]MBJ8746549.1 hypothetical protein [Citrobacter farmeri]MBJ8760057.1 hypothetical protein [Citrobacter farmeri]